jgi:integrase
MPRKKEKIVLTDKMLRAMRPSTPERRPDYSDAIVPGFGVYPSRVANERGYAASVAMFLYTRLPNDPKPKRHVLGNFPKESLECGRNEARRWLELISRGINPRQAEADRVAAQEEERQRAEMGKRAQEVLRFDAIVENYLQHIKAAGQRRAHIVEREVRRELLPTWGDRLATEITDVDVEVLIDAIKTGEGRARPARTQAHSTYNNIRTIFNWARRKPSYKALGLKTSPCADLSPKALLDGGKNIRQRVLNDDELFAYVRSVKRMPYPWGQRYLVIAFTGGRVSEVTEAEWSEFDLRKKLWTIPGARYKSDADHLIPLSDDAVDLLRALPRFRGGSFVFSCAGGQSPVWDSDRQKKKLKARMLWMLKALARLRGTDPRIVKLPNFTNHDVRRTMRTRMSGLRTANDDPIAEKVCELAIGHSERDPVKRAYDLHRYQPELRAAFDAWAKHIREIITNAPNNTDATPAQDNVVAMPSRARA